jgi:hypothetical protein
VFFVLLSPPQDPNFPPRNSSITECAEWNTSRTNDSIHHLTTSSPSSHHCEALNSPGPDPDTDTDSSGSDSDPDDLDLPPPTLPTPTLSPEETALRNARLQETHFQSLILANDPLQRIIASSSDTVITCHTTSQAITSWKRDTSGTLTSTRLNSSLLPSLSTDSVQHSISNRTRSASYHAPPKPPRASNVPAQPHQHQLPLELPNPLADPSLPTDPMPGTYSAGASLSRT